jgi:phosphatidylserine synthase
MSWVHTKVSFYSVYQSLGQIIIKMIFKLWSCNSIVMVESWKLFHEINYPKFKGKFGFCENLTLPIILIMYCQYICICFVSILITVSISKYIYISRFSNQEESITKNHR